MRNTLIHRYLTEDIRTFQPLWDDQDTPLQVTFDWGSMIEFSDCNKYTLARTFNEVKHNTKVIVEIGVARISDPKFKTAITSYEQTSTSVLLQSKLPETLYLGIDMEDRSFIHSYAPNTHTLKAKSEDYEVVLNKFKELNITKIDFLFIDGWHSINQVIDELWYLDFMKPGGVICYHDTNHHPGPTKIMDKFRPEYFEAVKHCQSENGWGLGVVKIK